MTQDIKPSTKADENRFEALYPSPALTPKQRARMRQNWEVVNATRARSDRQRAFWHGVAWALTGAAAAALFWLIFGWAVANAMAELANAPALLRH